MLDVGDRNSVYWETSGNPTGKPVVLTHGGPGTGSDPVSRQHFDPHAYRIVQFDQRGCGQSTPGIGEGNCDLSVNTTWHLVADMESLREHLGIDRWQVSGGSWGATLALAYAQAHPDRVSEMVLHGVFTARENELAWLYRGGAAHLFPDAWETFLEALPEAEQHDPLAAYTRLVAHPDAEVAEQAAIAWSAWEGAITSLTPSPMAREQYTEPAMAVPFARIALHYLSHRAWLAEGQLIRDASKLAGIPGVLVQGRYDTVCPPSTAYALHQAWQGAELILLNTAGHSVWDPGMHGELTAATDRFAYR